MWDIVTRTIPHSTLFHAGYLLTNTLLPSISVEFLTRMMEGKPIERVHVSVADREFVYEF